MSYIPITPFGRPVDATLIEHQQYVVADQSLDGVNKYEIVRELTAARKALGISNRELSLLQVLLSFYPKTVLGGPAVDLLVYPSNAAICERLNGMPCSTMRRHLAGLVNSGLILRRDSPNGKRYVKRYGNDPQAFGFDLTPLLTRYAEICEIAASSRAETENLLRLRRTVSLMRRDLTGLAEYGAKKHPELSEWDIFTDLAILTARDLRRKLSYEELRQLERSLFDALKEIKSLFDFENTAHMSTNDYDSEHLIQNSNKDYYEQIEKDTKTLPNIPLTLITEACTELKTYVPNIVKNWEDLVRAAEKVRPMMGITPATWDEATVAMGREETAVVVLAILERFSEIKSPGAYLRCLAKKATEGRFSSGPMIMALLNPKLA